LLKYARAKAVQPAPSRKKLSSYVLVCQFYAGSASRAKKPAWPLAPAARTAGAARTPGR